MQFDYSHEVRLRTDPLWALTEADRFLNEKPALQPTLWRVIDELKQQNIPYAVVGGIASLFYGDPRVENEIEILVSPESFKRLGARTIPKPECASIS
jgi:hypothetical protein